MRNHKVVIIGAGTAGLTARREVEHQTDDYVVIDGGTLGTTCARVGCMPSKVLIQVANDYYRGHKFDDMGIRGGDQLSVDGAAVMMHVRKLRDRFVRGVLSGMDDWQDHFLAGYAKFIDPHTVQVGDEKIQGEKFIVATGSRPIIPGAWQAWREHLVTTDELFEWEDLPETVAVIGLGVIGVELGQALSRLGVDVVGITVGKAIGALTDPLIQDYALEKLQNEFPVHINGADIKGVEAGKLLVEADGKTYKVDKAVLAMGRRHNFDRLGWSEAGLQASDNGLPQVDTSTMQVIDAPHIFVAGDANTDRPILHEAADEGRIAGYNAVHDIQCFKRRVPLGITFSDPNIATVGRTHASLANTDYVTGKVSFEGQGRSIVKLKEQGLLHVYAEKTTGKILGAELQAPGGEHLAHLLAWAISVDMTVAESLRMPFYHPVIEEGLRTALRHAFKKTGLETHFELFRCEDPPIR